jgi:hypothetical protein
MGSDGPRSGSRRTPNDDRNNERLDARLADTSGYSSKIIEQTDFPGDALAGRAGLDEFLLQAPQRPLLDWLERASILRKLPRL